MGAKSGFVNGTKVASFPGLRNFCTGSDEHARPSNEAMTK